MCPQLAPRRPERRFPSGTGRTRSVQPVWLDFRCGSGSPNLWSRSTFHSTAGRSDYLSGGRRPCLAASERTGILDLSGLD